MLPKTNKELRGISRNIHRKDVHVHQKLNTEMFLVKSVQSSGPGRELRGLEGRFAYQRPGPIPIITWFLEHCWEEIPKQQARQSHKIKSCKLETIQVHNMNYINFSIQDKEKTVCQ